MDLPLKGPLQPLFVLRVSFMRKNERLHPSYQRRAFTDLCDMVSGVAIQPRSPGSPDNWDKLCGLLYAVFTGMLAQLARMIATALDLVHIRRVDIVPRS